MDEHHLDSKCSRFFSFFVLTVDFRLPAIEKLVCSVQTRRAPHSSLISKTQRSKKFALGWSEPYWIFGRSVERNDRYSSHAELSLHRVFCVFYFTSTQWSGSYGGALKKTSATDLGLHSSAHISRTFFAWGGSISSPSSRSVLLSEAPCLLHLGSAPR